MYASSKHNLAEDIGDISDDETFKDNGKEVKLDEFS